MEGLKTWAIVYSQFTAIHCWPDAPDSEDFLRNPHRHLFTVEVWIEQKHNNRDVEYYNFKKWLTTQLLIMPKHLHHSCEHYCNDIADIITYSYPGRDLKITVREDALEGACKEYVSK